MKKRDGMGIFGAITGSWMLIINVLHSVWTCWLVVEQINTGWGFSTKIEMLALLPWTLEFFSLPFLLAEVVYLVMSIFKRHRKAVLIINIVLFVLVIAQFFVTNLFMFH